MTDDFTRQSNDIVVMALLTIVAVFILSFIFARWMGSKR